MADKTTLLEKFLLSLKCAGFQAELMFDVGANRGDFTRHFLQHFPDTRCVLFEPLAHLASEVGDLIVGQGRVELISKAVSDQCGEAEFVVQLALDTASSLNLLGLDENEQRRLITVDTITLEQYVLENGLRPPNFLKIDAEGADLKVLNAASGLLGSTEVILVEAMVSCPWNENTVAAITAKLEAEGYRLVGITDMVYTQSEVLWLVELAFLLKESSLCEAYVSMS